MPHHPAVAVTTAMPADAKARRKLEDQRRMAFRRAIEHYNEARRLDQEIHDHPELIAVNYVRSLRASAPAAVGRTRSAATVRASRPLKGSGSAR